MHISETIIKRIEQRTELKESGCLCYTGPDNGNGYGVIRYMGKPRYVHILIYLFYKSEIPKGLEISHICSVRNCINIDHLEAITHRENMIKGDTIIRKQVEKDHCPNGHMYSGLNNRNDRVCHTCGAANARRYRARGTRIKMITGTKLYK